MPDYQKRRRLMRAIYFTDLAIRQAAAARELPALAASAVLAASNASLSAMVIHTPAEVFRADKPEIDPRRARRWRRNNKPVGYLVGPNVNVGALDYAN